MSSATTPLQMKWFGSLKYIDGSNILRWKSGENTTEIHSTKLVCRMLSKQALVNILRNETPRKLWQTTSCDETSSPGTSFWQD